MSLLNPTPEETLSLQRRTRRVARLDRIKARLRSGEVSAEVLSEMLVLLEELNNEVALLTMR